MFTTDRTELREVFFRAWHNYREQRLLEGIETVIVDVALRHPQYHHVLDAIDAAGDRDYHTTPGGPNPFLHMGLHIAIAEQLSIDQPPGVRGCFQRLVARLPDSHAVEHAMMECLGEMLRHALRAGQAPNQDTYLECLKRLAPEP
ncbi:MAG TPA: DUF1841 family protein, partial [Burkholderiales bacterium]|nr:DUF1841 family protein [Burkholderiales bacterium]